MSILESRDVFWPDEAACAASARALAGCPGITRAFVTLHGDLGAGKTTFTRHLLHALGVAGRIKSPTYALMEVYELAAQQQSPGRPKLRAPPRGADDERPPRGGTTAWHFDFYRFDDPQEWEDAGFRDVFAGPGLKLVEWPEKAQGLLPVPDLRLGIAIDDGPDGSSMRRVRFTAATALGRTLLP